MLTRLLTSEGHRPQEMRVYAQPAKKNLPIRTRSAHEYGVIRRSCIVVHRRFPPTRSPVGLRLGDRQLPAGQGRRHRKVGSSAVPWPTARTGSATPSTSPPPQTTPPGSAGGYPRHRLTCQVRPRPNCQIWAADISNTTDQAAAPNGGSSRDYHYSADYALRSPSGLERAHALPALTARDAAHGSPAGLRARLAWFGTFLALTRP